MLDPHFIHKLLYFAPIFWKRKLCRILIMFIVGLLRDLYFKLEARWWLIIKMYKGNLGRYNSSLDNIQKYGLIQIHIFVLF